VAASLITPGDLIYTSIILTVPLYLLYEMSIWLSYIVWRRREKKRKAEEAAEAVA
jgi:sec-independent protein translocase protein TatC